MEKIIKKYLQFTDEELYCYCMENSNYTSPESVRDAYTKLIMTLGDYIARVSESSFAEGFRYAVNLLRGGIDK